MVEVRDERGRARDGRGKGGRRKFPDASHVPFSRTVFEVERRGVARVLTECARVTRVKWESGGDGERYHVLAYVDDSGLEEALEREAEPLAPAEEAVTAILDGLSVPADQRPDFADCGVFTADHPSDDRNRLYLLVNSAGTRLYVVEFFL